MENVKNHKTLQLLQTSYEDDLTPMDRITCVESMLNRGRLVIANFPSSSINPIRLDEILDERSLTVIKNAIQGELDFSREKLIENGETDWTIYKVGQSK